MTEQAQIERTDQSAPLSVLCDSIRASTTRYALLRRILIGLAGHLKPHYRSELHTCIDNLDRDVSGIETALKQYCAIREGTNG